MIRPDVQSTADIPPMYPDPPGGGRVAAVIPAEAVSGPGRQLAALAAQLGRAGWRMRVFVLWRTGHPRPAYAGFLERNGIDYELIGDNGPLDTGLITRLRGRLAIWQPDVVQTHGYKATAAVLALRRRAAWRWVGYYHGATAESRRAVAYHWLDRVMLSRADTIVVMSSEQASLFAPRHPVRVIHNAVVPMEASPDVERSAVIDAVRSLPRPLLAFVGRLSHEKGADVLLDALSRLKARGFPGGLAIAGSGPEAARLEALARTAGLGLVVKFLGDVSAVDALYESVDVVVLPSRSEGLPNVLLEALHAGKPVIATRVGAVADVLSDPRAGTIVTPDDAGALADAVQHAVQEIGDPAAVAARETVVRAFSVERRAARHLDVYRALLSRTGKAVA